MKLPRLALAFFLLAIMACAPLRALAADDLFQFAVPYQTEKGQNLAYLWIPSDAKQVRGVILAGSTLMEKAFVQDEVIRKACTDQQLALVFLKTGLKSVDTQSLLNDLAKTSGYAEIAVAPLMFVGHSAGGPQAQELAAKFADRCFGLIQYRGGGPFNGNPQLPPSIPSLMMVGHFDEFGGGMREADGRESWMRSTAAIAEYRAKDPGHIATIIVEPGAGHFAWSPRNAVIASLFIRKAAASRIPETWPTDAKEPVALKKIDPDTGWLADLNLMKPEHDPAPVASYAGDKTRTSWLFDEEMAKAAAAYHQGMDRKDQFIRWADGHWVDAGARFFFTGISWVDDGVTFQVHPVYADKYPAVDKGPRWAMKGQPAGASNVPIKVKTVSGPFVPVANDKFQMKFSALNPADESYRGTFLAYSEGDKEYRYTEQVGMLPRGFGKLTGGKDQVITFPELPDLKPDSKPVELHATSDAGLPVAYYVAYGPARIEAGKLVLTDVPQRASFPIAVKVVAWQFGSGVDPKVKTADPVAREFKITR